MRNAFIFHGTGGFPEENWFPWLKQKLETNGFNVIIPRFPTPENQTPETWFHVFKQYEKIYSPDTILIGHSLGGSFLLRVLEKIPIQIKAAYLVATPIGIPPIKNWLSDLPFNGHPFEWKTIRSRAEKFTVFHSDNDPYVGLENGKELAKQLGVKLTFIPNAGHFNAKASYTSFEALYEKITEP
ncbi:MAG: serine hydrolase family protein [Candidatus Diapherotrites archaeon]|nr:serine hydrolase family protein [Candidatus Diapherotrites archaeon]